nr:uncharacterized protein LOC127304936 [Lolium perenne]
MPRVSLVNHLCYPLTRASLRPFPTTSPDSSYVLNASFLCWFSSTIRQIKLLQSHLGESIFQRYVQLVFNLFPLFGKLCPFHWISYTQILSASMLETYTGPDSREHC